MKHRSIDLSTITDWSSFHDLFSTTFHFRDGYGRNMDAWIDDMEDFAIGGDFLVLELIGMHTLKTRCPEIYEALNECAAFINHRALSATRPAVVALSYGND